MATGGPPSLPTDAVPAVDRPTLQHQLGYRPEIFAKQDDREKYSCRYCHKILRDPLQARECGHRFCLPCQKAIEEEININKKTLHCEACRDEEEEETILNPSHMFPDKGIRKEMSKVMTKCPNEACGWSGPFGDYIKHETECKFQPVVCEHCKEFVSKTKIEGHKKNECPQRLVKCKHCGAEMPFMQEMNHTKMCPKYPQTCEQCAKKDVPRDLMKKHKSRDCSNRTVSCPIEGCSAPEPQSRFQAHVQKDQAKHLTWVVSRIAELEESVNAFLEPNSASGASASTRQTVGADLTQNVEVLKAKIEQLEDQLARQGRPGGGAGGGAVGGPSEQAGAGAEASANVTGGSSVERLNAMEFKVNSLEPILSVLHGEMNRCIGAIEALEARLVREATLAQEFRQKVERYETTINHLNTTFQQREARIKDLDTKVAGLGLENPDGTLLWKIPNFTQVRQEAMAGNMSNIHSKPFFTGPLGYKMCVRLYPNGDGMGKGTHLSLFFTLMRSQHDALLPWPFKQKVYFMLIDQTFKKHIVDAFRSEPNSSSFQRPTSEMNIATGCPLFMQLNRLSTPGHGYLKDDTMYIRVVVETDGIDDHLKQFDPRNVPLASAGS